MHRQNSQIATLLKKDNYLLIEGAEISLCLDMPREMDKRNNNTVLD